MTLTKYLSYPSLNLINELFNDVVLNDTSLKTPDYDIIDNDNEYLIEIMLPGIKKSDVNINIDKDILTINAERIKEEEIKYKHNNFYFGTYEKKFILPESFDDEHIKASMEEGILKMKIPKLKAENKIKAIEIT